DAAREEAEAWIRRAVDGDASAFRRIVEAHHRPLFHLATRLVCARAEAQDLVHESFAKACEHPDRFDARIPLSTWLHRITLNTCRDHLKSARRRERASGSDPAPGREDELPGPEEQLQQKRLAQRVRVAMEQLKPTYREVLVLKDMQGLSYQEIHAI